MNNSAINICVQVFVWIYIFFISLAYTYTPRSRIAGNSVFIILRICQRIFQSEHTILHSNKQCMMVPISLHPYQHLLFLFFLILAILVGMKWYFVVVLICFSVIAHDVEHLFVWLLTICIHSWRGVYSIPLLIKKKNCYYSIVDLQCLANSCCTANWPSHIYIHIHIPFLMLSSIMVCPKRLDRVPWAIQ